jgi:hypothetical protein
MAGRFQGSGSRGGQNGAAPARGMSIDERLPMKTEADRRRADELATEIDHFLAGRPDATWDFAAGPELHRVVLEQLPEKIRQRLRRAVSKDLVNQPVTALREQFAGSGR